MSIYVPFHEILFSITIDRAYPGSEFVVANTLAKWKYLEPNEIDFSQICDF